MKADGTLYYKNLPVGYSGYLHRASLQQAIPVGDVRNMKVRPELEEIFREIVGDPKKLNASDAVTKSIAFCERARMLGYIIVYEPSMKHKK